MPLGIILIKSHMKKFIPVLACLFFACSHQPLVTPADAQEFNRPPLAIDSKSPLYLEAQRFDLFIKKQLSADESRAYLSECQKKASDSPFCYSVLHSKALFEMTEAKTTPKSPPPLKQIVPISPNYKGDKLTNWNEMRKADVPVLLKGFLPLSRDELKELGQKALHEKKCPNRVAIAAAATLEDYLPAEINGAFLAELYEKGGSCRKETKADRENFITRAALFYVYDNQWKKAEKLLSKVTPNDAFSGRVLFWLAVSKSKNGDSKGAAKVFSRLLSFHPFSFHSVMAAKREHSNPLPGLTEKSVVPVVSKKSKPFNLIVNQVEILTRNDFLQTAALLVDYGLMQFSKVEPEAKLYLASLGDAKARSIYASNLAYYKEGFRSKDVLELAYPKPFEAVFNKVKRNAPVNFLYSIARKESMFYPLAISYANAQGLLQLNPDTVERMGFNKPNLLDPYTNLDIGAEHMTDLLKSLDGKLYWAAAAYNAGINPVRSWMRRYKHEDILITLDLIPYRETREYVGSVMTNYYWYSRLYGNVSEALPSLP